MNLKIFLLVILVKTDISKGEAICNYSVDKKSIYKCKLSVKNDDEIGGTHLNDKSDDDVLNIQSSESSNSTDFPTKICEKFKNLQSIHLVNVYIQNIDENSLKSCKNLKIFNVAVNKVREIPENMFTENLNLVEVDLSQNKLTNLGENLFKNLKNLQILKLTKNKLSDLPKNIFNPLENLKHLSLINNEIKILKTSWFKQLHNLQQLFLSFNRIEELPEGMFINLSSLKSLDLSVNNLTTIHADSFGSLPNLMEIYLEYNNINAIDQKVIDDTGISIIELGFGDKNVKVNLCVNKNFRDMTRSRIQLKSGLKKCFENYRRRMA